MNNSIFQIDYDNMKKIIKELMKPSRVFKERDYLEIKLSNTKVNLNNKIVFYESINKFLIVS